MKERLQKILSQAGICSRRKAEEMIEAGKVTVNGQIVRELGSEADPVKDRIEVNGETVKPERKKYFLFYKPDNVITSVSDPQGRRTVMDYFRTVRERIFPVGRLDYHSEGLLIMTNDGDLDYILTHPSHEVEKTYEVTVRGRYSMKLADKMSRGVRIDTGITAPCEIEVLEYNKEKNYHMIFTNVVSDILYADKKYDITNSVIEFLNKKYGPLKSAFDEKKK